MRVTILSILFALGLTAIPATADEGQPVDIRGILVQCYDEPGQTDRSLAAYEPNLKRLLRFESYKSAGQGSAKITTPGSGGFSIGNGNRLEIEVLEVNGESIRARVKWSGGGKEIMNTVLNLRRGVPAVLGRGAPVSGGAVYAALVIAQ
jgi:hypothetical protein